eukprot:TRINITY_DN18139_c0_g1_i1.p1 TRINITY_DN18139_c0_g1~~TRINITY_DN18139_c0_g1_i1.p1  ORF type:complete len:839 (-),score=125.68 TRINITY_DN18139_c0_g1_i1:18-2534(-)
MRSSVRADCCESNIWCNGGFDGFETTSDGCERLLQRSLSQSSCATATSFVESSNGDKSSCFGEGRLWQSSSQPSSSRRRSHKTLRSSNGRNSENPVIDAFGTAELNAAGVEPGPEAGDSHTKFVFTFDVPWACCAASAKKYSFRDVSEEEAEQGGIACQFETLPKVVAQKLREPQARFREQLKTDASLITDELLRLRGWLERQLDIETKVLEQVLDGQHGALTQKLGELQDLLLSMKCPTKSNFNVFSKQLEGVQAGVKEISQQLQDLRAAGACPLAEPQPRRKRSEARLRRQKETVPSEQSLKDVAGCQLQNAFVSIQNGGSCVREETGRSARHSDKELPSETTESAAVLSKAQTASIGSSEISSNDRVAVEDAVGGYKSAFDPGTEVSLPRRVEDTLKGGEICGRGAEALDSIKSICSIQKVFEAKDAFLSNAPRSVNVPRTLANRKALRASQRQEPRMENGVVCFVKSGYFEPFVAGFVVLSTVILGVQTDFEAQDKDWNSSWFSFLDIAIALFFTAELCLRLWVHGWTHFSKDRFWTFFDISMVFTTNLEVLSSFVLSQVEVDFTGFFRVLRLVKLLRFARVVSLLRELRMVVYLISASMTSFFWSLTLMLSMIFCAAIYFTDAVTRMIRAGVHEAEDVRAQWGSVSRSSLSLFMSVTGGDDWSIFVGTMASDSGSMGWLNTLCFCFFVAFMILVTMNLVTGVFVECAQTQIKLDRVQDYLTKTKMVIGIAPGDDDLEISWAEFEGLLDTPEIQTFFQQCDFDVKAAQGLFHMLDADGSGTLSMDEFIKGCERLRGEARSVDLVHLSIQLADHMTKISDALGKLSGHVEKFVSR